MLPWLHPSPARRDAALQGASLSKLVREDMLGMILHGLLQPGQRINEPDVAARLGISRVPVREALRELESSGLVVAKKNCGVFVRQLDAAEVASLYELRGLLDGYAGRCAAALAVRHRKALVAALDTSIAAMNDAAEAADVQRYYRENLRFHWAFVEAAENPPLAETYRGIIQKLHVSRLKNLARDTGMRVSIDEHVKITRSLRDANAKRCESLMARHVGDSHRRLVAAGG